MLPESDVHAVIHCVNFAQVGGGVGQYASPGNPSCVKCKVT